MTICKTELGAALSTAAAEMSRWEHLIAVWEQAERVSDMSGQAFYAVLFDNGFLEQLEVLIQGSRLYKGDQ
jgi:hypothetical protein